MSDFHIKILGSRGSCAVDDDIYRKYGGATSCIYVNAGDEIIILDAGSGFMCLKDIIKDVKRISVLISHFHIDHIIGLFTSPIMFSSDMEVNIYSREDTYKMLSQAMCPPIWPVTPQAFTANINYYTIADSFVLDKVKISTLEGKHPGGVALYKLEYGERSLVYATDCEIDHSNIEEIANFSHGTNLLLCDGQYDIKEAEQKRGYGHTDWQTCVKLAKLCKAETLGIIHHDPLRNDSDIDIMQENMKKYFENSFFVSYKEVRYI